MQKKRPMRIASAADGSVAANSTYTAAGERAPGSPRVRLGFRACETETSLESVWMALRGAGRASQALQYRE